MAVSNEHRIVAKIIDEQDVNPLLSRGVTPDWFVNETHREAIGFILRHQEKYGNLPTKVTFTGQMGTTYRLFTVEESMDYLLDKQAEFLRWQAARRVLPDVEDLLDAGNTEGAIAAIQSALQRIDSYQPVATTLVDSMEPSRLDARWDEYQRRKSDDALIGMSTGFPSIDDTTLGLQPGQLVTILAQPKVGKTTLCLSIGNHVFHHYDAAILFVSYEMSIREMEMRQESLMAGISFRDLQNGSLTPLEERKYEKWLAQAKTEYDLPFHFMDAISGSTVGAVRAQAERLEPTLIIIDGIYMMPDEITGESNTPQALTNITRSLKRMAGHLQIPVMINTQALEWKSKGTKISMSSAGYSSSFAQDSDVILGLERVPVPKGADESDYATSRYLKVLASRNTGLTSVELYFNYNEGTLAEAS